LVAVSALLSVSGDLASSVAGLSCLDSKLPKSEGGNVTDSLHDCLSLMVASGPFSLLLMLVACNMAMVAWLVGWFVEES